MSLSAKQTGDEFLELPSSDYAFNECAELIRDLHQLLQSYSPAWYTEEMDARMQSALADVDAGRGC